jgi:hypothetical protein
MLSTRLCSDVIERQDTSVKTGTVFREELISSKAKHNDYLVAVRNHEKHIKNWHGVSVELTVAVIIFTKQLEKKWHAELNCGA